MKNEVFKSVTETVEAFQKGYQEKLQAAQDQLQQEKTKLAQAESRAAEAVAADDQATWKKADKDRADATAGIKYGQERLAMIQGAADLPLADFESLRDQIEAEQGRAILAFIKELQKLYTTTQEHLEKLLAVQSEARTAAAKLYAAGGRLEEGYTRIPENYQVNWLSLTESGQIFEKSLLDVFDKPNFNKALHRAVYHATRAIQKVEGK